MSYLVLAAASTIPHLERQQFIFLAVLKATLQADSQEL
jgi:hypothetical protein